MADRDNLRQGAASTKATAASSGVPARRRIIVNPLLRPKEGAITFDSEGTEGGRFHSRKLHVPPGWSGLTIGRGYDMRQRVSTKIAGDLVRAGLPAEDAKVISKAAGLSGVNAQKFVKDHKLESFEIGSDTQVRLFEIAYAEQKAEVRRISERADVVQKYGKVDFDKLHPAVRDLLVDLKYRGDYTPQLRQLVQKAAAENDLVTLQKIMGNRDTWRNVPQDRFNRRKQLIDDAVTAAQAKSAGTLGVVFP